MKTTFRFFILIVICTSCKRIQNLSDVITNPSAREVLERNFEDNDSLFSLYQSEFDRAKFNNLELKLPAVVNGISDSSDFKILSYKLSLKRGEKLVVDCNIISDSLQLAFDIFQFENDSLIARKSLISNEPQQNYLSLNIKKSGDYKLVAITEAKYSKNFSIIIYTEPTLNFPVRGKGNKAVQSFWGAPRSGGKRKHKGIDIFAKRGTPVVAATDGYISNTGNRGLGGKQVWLRDGTFRQSLYYAHLDSIAVNAGTRVKIGDTLGFVGNTGNAKTTAPHLHFGIYARGGAVDPFPFVKITEKPDFKNVNVIYEGKTKLRKNELRVSPNMISEKIAKISKNKTLKIYGKINSWFHVRVEDSLEGFMHQSLVKTLD